MLSATSQGSKKSSKIMRHYEQVQFISVRTGAWIKPLGFLQTSRGLLENMDQIVKVSPRGLGHFTSRSQLCFCQVKNNTPQSAVCKAIESWIQDYVNLILYKIQFTTCRYGKKNTQFCRCIWVVWRIQMEIAYFIWQLYRLVYSMAVQHYMFLFYIILF